MAFTPTVLHLLPLIREVDASEIRVPNRYVGRMLCDR